MPTFRYVAKDKQGKIHRGNTEAVDEDAVRKQLEDSGYWLTEAFLIPSSDADKSNADGTDNEKPKQIYIAVGLVIMALVLWLVVR